MSRPDVFLGFILVLIGLIPAAVQGLIQRIDSDIEHTNGGADPYNIIVRDKRTVSAAARGIIGLGAVRRVLTGAKQIHSRKKDVNLYVKVGSSKTAMDDFNSMDPTHVKEMDGFRFGLNFALGPTYVGKVGDRRLRLLPYGSKGDNLPTLEIHRIKPGYKMEKIIYKLNDD